MIEDLAKRGYEFHARASSAGTEFWEWPDIPAEAREHWRKLVGTLLDYQLEHRRRKRRKKVPHAKN